MKLRIALFYHSLVSDWNHGNAHFLRGIAAELIARGHVVRVYEPDGGWSRRSLVSAQGHNPIDLFYSRFPELRSIEYTLAGLDIDGLLESVDMAIVHEWNDPMLISEVAKYRRRNPDLRVFFHDTHHRAVSAPDDLAKLNLSDYDGVLAYGASLKHAYEKVGWNSRVYVWHEAVDVRTFYPRESCAPKGDVVWIGNWGDGERGEELREFLIDPIRSLDLTSAVYGVRYPQAAIEELAGAGIDYRGWLPNFDVPETFSGFKATVHVPRRPYARQLSGIPTIRPFEALACGIPLISAPWTDSENLFRIGQDLLMVENGSQMRTALRDVLNDSALSESLRRNGLETILRRHTCGHRVDELFALYQTLKPAVAYNEVAV